MEYQLKDILQTIDHRLTLQFGPGWSWEYKSSVGRFAATKTDYYCRRHIVTPVPTPNSPLGCCGILKLVYRPDLPARLCGRVPPVSLFGDTPAIAIRRGRDALEEQLHEVAEQFDYNDLDGLSELRPALEAVPDYNQTTHSSDDNATQEVLL